MIPDREVLYTDSTGVVEQPSLTYAIEPEREDAELYSEGRITGLCSGIEAMKQAVYKILRTERGRYLIYGSYGTEHYSLFGKPGPIVIPELERMITEALKRDSRIKEVDGFEFDERDGRVSAVFTVHTIFGDFSEVIENV